MEPSTMATGQEPLIQPVNAAEDATGDGASMNLTYSSVVDVDSDAIEIQPTGVGFDNSKSLRSKSEHVNPLGGQAIRRRYRTIEERRNDLNNLFGVTPWKSHVQKRKLETHSKTYQQLYAPIDKPSEKTDSRPLSIGNIAWVLLFGWWLFLLYGIVGCLLAMTYFGIPFARRCFKLGGYFLWPFGGHVFQSAKLASTRRKEYGPTRCSIGHGLWYIIAVPVLSISHAIVSLLCWLMIVFIPSSKVNRIAVTLLFKDILEICVSRGMPSSEKVVICTYFAANKNYYKYHVGGMNVMMVNMLLFVVLSLVLGYIVKLEQHVLIFLMCLVSTVPLAYYIGLAVSSISAQSTFAVGATLNAAFGSVIEMILYFFAIKQGLGDVVRSAVIGSLLGTMLLLPGLSMVFGGMKKKIMRFNSSSAGVSSVLLVAAIVGAFTPTIFYQVHGNYHLNCGNCSPIVSGATELACQSCHYVEKDLDSDPAYVESAQRLMWICAAILPIGYLIGCLFTMKTHTDIIYPETDWGDEQPPEWTKLKCVIILLVSTVLFAFVAELLVSSIHPVLSSLGISEAFIGVTLIALVPNTAEFVNAIQFALQDNMSLAIEIGSTAAVQISLLQVPLLVLISALFSHYASAAFTLIFPTFTVFAVVFAVLIFNYVMAEGRANYFQGSALIIIYSLLIASFIFGS